MKAALAKRKEHGLETWVGFLDITKAFDTVPRDEEDGEEGLLWKALRLLGCPEHLLNIIKSLHRDVLLLLSEDDESTSLRANRGVRQGDIIGPPLFNLFMAAVFLTWQKKKQTSKVQFYCDADRHSFVLRGRPVNQAGIRFIFDTSLYADDTNALAADRTALASDLRGLISHFKLFGFIIHQGAPGVKSKAKVVAFLKQPYHYADRTTHDDIDLSDIVIDPVLGTFIPVVTKMISLGTAFECTLNDSVDVAARVKKACGVFGRYAKRIFCN